MAHPSGPVTPPRGARLRRPAAPPVLDEAVVAAAVRGDQAAFTVVYRYLSPRVLRYLALLVGPDAEDVAADTWVEVLRSLPTFHAGPDRLGAWVIGVARHRASSHHRAARSRPRSVADVAVFTEVLAGADDTPGSAEEQAGTARALARIAGLPPDQAEAVFLRSVVGLDAVAAAGVLGKRPGAVRTAAHRGLRTLSRQLAAETDLTRGV